MKATTLRPFLIVLLFGFLPTSGWMIVRDGAPRTITRVITNSCPMPGAAAHRRAAGSWPASAPPAATPHGAAVYAQPSASTAPHASHGPASQAGAEAPKLVAADYPDEGFGDFSVPGALPGPASGEAPDTGPDPTGPVDNGTTGGPRDPSLGLLDPPGGTGTGGTPGSGAGGTPGSGAGGTSTGGLSPTGSTGNQRVTAPEPSTLALFLVGTAALGIALHRRRLRD